MLSFVCDSILINYVQCNWVFIIFLSDCCKSVEIHATGAAAQKWPHYILDSFVATSEEHEGAEVYYMKSADIYLYRDSDNTWRAGDEIGYQGRIKSVDTADCPESNTQWKYADYDDAEDGWYWHSGDIKVHCSFS